MCYRRPGSICTLLAVALLLSACGGTSEHQDLLDYMEETKRRPAGQIEPLPPFVPYKSFVYSAMAMRSPFDPPVDDIEMLVRGKQTDVKPDLNREKEFLESFNIASLRMVGTLERGGTLWALINDGVGGIHRVKQGNYIGKNHGRIVATSPLQIEIIEIVPNGTDGWVERPQILQIAEKG
ncbi:MAG: pilus assembly protein PilP [Gammaproteobacteria bacterium]|uniref:pilus assembly protein PilP n=1 Tax=Pseudomaricurvus alcaniphilus TaxID=1166482 RepID=UPI00140C8ED6|nr:pilus assembly protein PilP [Pseudomaricurvus alcaniphilus]MBR9909828.1 pilus assembly protein PilP [Gammaproteobacteria bacterium]NHN38554.1 pilus assembly protein PilP [Pseudomaricurvus alcaniphilus]